MSGTPALAKASSRLALRRGAYLRSYAYHFISQFAPGGTRVDIERALATKGPQD